MPSLGAGGAMRRRGISPDEDDLDYVEHEVAQITSTGSVNATFRIPGLTTIPSDDDEHNVTIADLKLDAKVTWVCIPKSDTRVHLEVRPNPKYCPSIFSVFCFSTGQHQEFFELRFPLRHQQRIRRSKLHRTIRYPKCQSTSDVPLSSWVSFFAPIYPGIC